MNKNRPQNLLHSPRNWCCIFTLFNSLKTESVKVSVTLRQKARRPVILDVKPYLGLKTRFLLLSDSCHFVDVGHSL
jgi:hypothetical protein